MTGQADGSAAYASDLSKATTGTGAPVYSTGGYWFRFGSDIQVTPIE
jgi:hypothetical protein